MIKQYEKLKKLCHFRKTIKFVFFLCRALENTLRLKKKKDDRIFGICIAYRSILIDNILRIITIDYLGINFFFFLTQFESSLNLSRNFK